MTLPLLLQTAIHAELSSMNVNTLSDAVEGLSKRYREPKKQSPYMAVNSDRSAYIACRMPATYAVVCRVFSEIQDLAPELNVKTIVDLGSGPGTALWAALEIFPETKELFALEGDAQLIDLGKRLNAHSETRALKETRWQHQDLCQLQTCPKADMIVASYAIGELSEEAQIRVLQQAWQAADKVLVLIEPGTPAGFERVLNWRSWLLTAHATILAPCPHEKSCPMAGGDWCHFSQRLSRSRLHRQLKGASLGHEDEKYSYIVAIKSSVTKQNVLGRILRHPQKHSGHLELVLCAPDGHLQKKIISRRDGDIYKKARKWEWGDLV